MMERSVFERQREVHVEKIREGLVEAAELVSVLNFNLNTWGRGSGETENLSQVWMQFQRRLLLLSEAFAGCAQ